MKIKPKIIAGTLSIITVLSFGAQLPVSAMGNRPGVFQEQFFPDEHNTADELWAIAERTNTAEDWEAAADAFDLAYEAYEKAGNVEIAREFLANAYKARGKSNQRNAEEISYNLSRFSVEEIEEKRNQAIDNWNKATECYEEAARLFKSTEARDDEDKKCEKLAKEVRANADFDTALAAWEKANKANTVESWNNAGQLFDQAVQSCRDAGFIEKSSSCDNKSREAFKKIESIKKSSIDTDLEEDTNVANQTEQVVVENEKVDEISGEAFLKQVENIITEVKNKRLNSKEVTDIATPNGDKSLNYIIQISLLNNEKSNKQAYISAAWEEANEQPTFEKWNKAGKLYEELAEDYKETGDKYEINRCTLNSKRAYANAAMAQEDWNKVAEINKELAEAFKNVGEDNKSNRCLARFKLAYAKIALKKAKKANTIEGWNEADTLCKEVVEAYKNSGEDDNAKKFIAEFKYEYAYAALKEAKEQPTFEKWNKADTLWKEAAEAYKNAGEDDRAKKFIIGFKQAYANAALKEARNKFTAESWNEVSKCYSEVAEACEKMADGESDVNEANSYRAMAKEYMEKANKYKQYVQILAKKDI